MIPEDAFNTGFARRVPRSQLVALVDAAAILGRVGPEARKRLFEATSDENITAVAVGLYHNKRYGCDCPASLAGYVETYTRDYDPDTVYRRHLLPVRNFPFNFDRLVEDKFGGRTQVLVVVND